jgi:hypothetical protein
LQRSASCNAVFVCDMILGGTHWPQYRQWQRSILGRHLVRGCTARLPPKISKSECRGHHGSGEMTNERAAWHPKTSGAQSLVLCHCVRGQHSRWLSFSCREGHCAVWKSAQSGMILRFRIETCMRGGSARTNKWKTGSERSEAPCHR